MSNRPGPLSARSALDDARRPLRKAVLAGAIVLAVVTALAAGLALPRGEAALWGVALGAVLGGLFSLLTAVTALVGVRAEADVLRLIVLGGWMLKACVGVGLFAVLVQLDFYDPEALVITLVATVVAVIGAEVWAVVSTPFTYVQPQPTTAS